MELLIEPYYRKKSCIIDIDKSFTKSFDYEVAYNDTYCFKVGFNLYSTDENYEDKQDIVATVEGQIFKYNRIDEYNIDIVDLADNVSNDVFKAIQTLADNNLFTDIDIEYMPLVCYLSRLYIYPKYRGNGIATYIYKNLQEIFEYVTSDLTSIFITIPCPQEPISEGKWENVRDNNMFKSMVKLLEKHDFKSVGDEGFYYKSYT